MEEDPFASQVSGQPAVDSELGDLPEVFDLSDTEAVEGFAREVLPSGSYHGWVESAEYKPSKAGIPMIEAVLQLEHPDDQSKTTPIWWYMSFGDTPDRNGVTTMQRTKGVLAKFFDIDWKATRPAEICEWLGGTRVLVSLRVKNNPPNHEYPGPQNQIRSVIPEPESFLES